VRRFTPRMSLRPPKLHVRRLPSLMLASVISTALVAAHVATGASSAGLTKSVGADRKATKHVATAKRDTSAPSTPTGLRVVSASRTAIKISWRASRDNTRVARYRVVVNGTLRDTTTSTSDTIGRLSCGTTYTMAVAAVDTAGNSSGFAAVVTSTTACPVTKP